MAVRIQTEDFDIAGEIARLGNGRDDIGAIVSFTGRVRGSDGGRDKLVAMSLEHYPGMTESELERIEAAAHARWPLAATTIIHRVGRLCPGDNIVLVLAASTHRQAAFDAAAFLMDYLKTDAPFWKQETAADGTSRWVDARECDESSRKRWEAASSISSASPKTT